MTNHGRIGFCIACAVLGSTIISAQENQPGSAAVPPESGVYYQGTSGWVPLRGTILLGFTNGTTRELFGVGRRQAVVEMPGPNAIFRIANPRPTFAVRGLSPATGVYLVRSTQKEDYRELRMPISSHITQWTHFRAKDLSEIEREPLFTDVMRVRPSADLKPGEYVLVSDLEGRYRAIHLGFEFGVASGTSAPK